MDEYQVDQDASMDQQQQEEEELTSIVQCSICKEGEMRPAIIKPHNVNVGIALIIVGVLSLSTGICSLIGLIALLAGLYFVFSSKHVWLCDNCRTTVERS